MRPNRALASELESPQHTTQRPGLFEPASLSQIIGIDLRALAAFRMLIGVVLLLDIADRVRNLSAHYTDLGIVPRQFLSQHPLSWSLHSLSGEAWLQVLLFTVAAGFALTFTLGLRTRLSTVICWVLLASVQTRNPYILNGGDVLLRCLMFWSMFLPLGARWSLDRKLRGAGTMFPQVLASAATVAILLQICVMYWFTAAMKNDAAWTSDFTAIYLALGYETYAMPLGTWLRSFPHPLAAMTAFVYALEWVGPCLIFSPYFNSRARGVAALLFIGMHVSLIFCMHLGFFSITSVAAWLLVLPSGFWNRAESILFKLFAKRTGGLALGSPKGRLARFLVRVCERPRVASYRVSTVVVLLLTFYMVSWNVVYSDPQRADDLEIADEAKWMAKLIRLDQRWSMFAPKPPTRSVHFQVIGHTAKGQEIDLWIMREREGKGSYMRSSTHRWRKYLTCLPKKSHARHRTQFVNWVKARWNQQPGISDSGQTVVDAKLMAYFKPNLPPKQRKKPTTRVAQLYSTRPSQVK